MGPSQIQKVINLPPYTKNISVQVQLYSTVITYSVVQQPQGSYYFRKKERQWPIESSVNMYFTLTQKKYDLYFHRTT